MLFGRRIRGTLSLDLASDTVHVTRFTLGAPTSVVKLTVALDGGAAGVDGQAVRGVIYDADGTLVATTAESIIDFATPGSWYDLSLLESDPAGVLLAAGDYDLGLLAGGPAETARVYVDTGGIGQHDADDYADGAAPTLAGTADSHALSIFATGFTRYAAPDETDDYFTTLPYADAQVVLGRTPPLAATALTAQVGWHGTSVDPVRGASAVVRSDGPLTDLVGERVKVSYNERSVVAHVREERDILEDMSLARRLFLGLATPNTDELAATIETLAAESE